METYDTGTSKYLALLENDKKLVPFIFKINYDIIIIIKYILKTIIMLTVCVINCNVILRKKTNRIKY